MVKVLITILIFILSLTCILLVGEATNPDLMEGTIEINVQRLRNNNGSVRIALYASSDTFCKKGKEIREVVIKPKEKRAIVKITEIPFGEYAIALYHDENNDDKFNKGLLYLVFREKFGFSNDVKPMFTPPDFESAKFTLDSKSQSITITAQ
jgi:uncharacterized protein (DUF2141 family)